MDSNQKRDIESSVETLGKSIFQVADSVHRESLVECISTVTQEYPLVDNT